MNKEIGGKIIGNKGIMEKEKEQKSIRKKE